METSNQMLAMFFFKQKREFRKEAMHSCCLPALGFLQAGRKACLLGTQTPLCQIHHQEQKEEPEKNVPIQIMSRSGILDNGSIG